MRFSPPKKHKMPAVILLLALFIALVGYIYSIVELHMKPTLEAIAEARGTILATQAINEVLQETVGGQPDAKSLLDVKLDQDGRVAFIQPNTVAFSKLSAITVIRVQERLKKLAEEKIDIPIGQAFGNSLLASFGPPVTIRVIPVGTVQANVINQFEAAGINQTKHMIYLTVTANVKIVVPLISKSVQVSTQVPITEYVVVGQVPNTYLQVPIRE